MEGLPVTTEPNTVSLIHYRRSGVNAKEDRDVTSQSIMISLDVTPVLE